MKTLLLAGFLAVSLGARAQAGYSGAAVPRHATLATIHTRDSSLVAYHKLGQVLVAAGYDLEKADYNAEQGYRELARLTTIDRALPARPAVRVALQAVLVAEPAGTAIELRGTYTLDGLTLLPIADRGRAGSPAGLAWTELQRVAQLFPAGVVAARRP